LIQFWVPSASYFLYKVQGSAYVVMSPDSQKME